MNEIHLTQTIEAAPAHVYRALTSQALLPLWLCNTALSTPVVDGSYFLGWNSGYYVAGHYTLIDPDRAVSLVWRGRGEPAETHVAITLTPDGPCTRLTLVHDQFGAGERWELVRAECHKGWQSGLEALKMMLEEGADLRVMRRPILGVMGGAPVSEPVAGFRINAPIPGLGAETAGLLADDIIVAMDGTPIVTFADYRQTMGRHRAGDTVAISFMRAAEQHEAELTLSSVPQAPVPATVGELAEQLAAVNDQLIAELSELLAGITPAEALFHPAAGEWNVVQVLAHLVYSEHWIHEALILARSDQPAPGFQNDDAHLAAMAHAFDNSVDRLIAEYRRQMTISEQMTATLPLDFAAADRVTFYNHAQTVLLAWPGHTRGHFAQMTSAIAAARAAGA